MKKLVLLFLALSFSINIFSQTTGKVEYKHLGVSFTIPNQWMGQEVPGMYLLTSNTIAGMIALVPHDQKYTTAEMKAIAQQGIVFGQGSNLVLQSNLEDISNTAIGGVFKGYLEWNPVKAYLIGLTNPHGVGVSIIALTTPEQFNDNYKPYAQAVYNSIQFRKPDTEAITKGWKEYLENHLLTYMNTTNSSGYGDDSFAGTSSVRKISLCVGGYFQVGGSSSVIASGQSSSLYSSSNEAGSGSWEIDASLSAEPILRLRYNNGRIEEYVLRNDQGKLTLGGSRYFRTNSGDNVPICN